VFCGNFKNGIREGLGIYEWNSGKKYLGYFKEDKISGLGVKMSSKSKGVYGKWENGELVEKL